MCPRKEIFCVRFRIGCIETVYNNQLEFHFFGNDVFYKNTAMLSGFYAVCQLCKSCKIWCQLTNGNKIKLTNTSTSAPVNDLFKDRFIKLAKHIEDCHSWSLVNYMSEWELDLEFYYKSEAHSLDIDVNSVNIQVIVYNNDSGIAVVNTTVGHNEWSKVLSILEVNNVIKDKKLCEWVDHKGNKIITKTVSANNTPTQATTTGYKEKFTKLLDYHTKHLPPIAVDPEIKVLNNDEFIYKEHHDTGAVENDYDLKVAVAVNGQSNAWDVSVYKYDTLVKIDFGWGWDRSFFLSLFIALCILIGLSLSMSCLFFFSLILFSLC